MQASEDEVRSLTRNNQRLSRAFFLSSITEVLQLDDEDSRAIAFDNSSLDFLDNAKLQQAFQEAEAITGKKVSLIGSVDDRKTLKTFDVFSLVANRYPEAACVWLVQLENISKANILDIFNRINLSCISPEASNFAQSILKINKHRLLTLRETLF